MHTAPHIPQTVQLLGGCFGIVVVLAIVLLFVAIYCKIFSKAGSHWAMGLLMFIPIANFIALLILAFCEWPIERELNAIRLHRQNPHP